MQLALPHHLAAPYHSGRQRARVVTEAWAEENLYCPRCTAESLLRMKANTPAIDFRCPNCEEPFQLKSQQNPIGGTVPDAGYAAMCRAIRGGNTPHLFLLHYDLEKWRVRTLIVIPRFAFTLSSIKKRNPSRPKGRNRDWVGCTILLNRMPADTRISVILEGRIETAINVRHNFKRLRPLEKLDFKQRGWTLDVLNVVRSLGKKSFALDDVYDHTEELGALHPDNRHVHDKIRQQLQALRDLGFVSFVSPGQYRITQP